MTSASIGFRKPTEFLGRNGVAKMAGIHVSRHTDALYIAPVTSRMRIGRAWMLVPLDAVPGVAKAMRELSDNAQTAAKRAA